MFSSTSSFRYLIKIFFITRSQTSAFHLPH
nr:MAG TPA: hypothetical protein [Caudoviricetes sp.]